uniref:5-oxoprolinase n=1 Tax=Steinernema glaseri TaxID=37863 RepID=A0A1I7YL10_9BILA
MKRGFGFAIDRGGTFTDVYVKYPDGRSRVTKLLSEDPANYPDAPTEAIRRVLSEEYGEIRRGAKIGIEHIEWIRMGTTVATNALLERKGERCALLITKGFKDLLYIGNQSRPNIFDLDIRIPDTLYEQVVEIDERIVLDDPTCEMELAGERRTTKNGTKIIVHKPIDRESVTAALRSLRSEGFTSVAVLFLHSYIYPEHEALVGSLASEVGFSNVSLSSTVIPMIKAVPRGFTACADAYLTPVIQKYIQNFRAAFEDNLEGVRVEFMQSDGGLCPIQNFFGSRAILSGPAGGVVGVSLTAYDSSTKEAVIGFDMGGTSTDVSRYAGEFDHVVETVTAGVTIQAPQLDIHTVAAGGGSRLFFRDGLFVVGPESAGSNPGPVCYRKNGYLTVTDANLVLGRILPKHFPHIFGPNENQPLDRDAAMKSMSEVTVEANKFLKPLGRPELSVAETALGFIEVANESMCRPIRALTQARGYDTSRHTLACFGGAGGQHACAIAKALGMRTVKIHKYSGILSAYGIALADAVVEKQESAMKDLTEESFPYLEDRLKVLTEESRKELRSQGFTDEHIRFEEYLHLRYARTDCAIMCQAEERTVEGFRKSFSHAYQRQFGFTISGRTIIVDDIRVRAVGVSNLVESDSIPKADDAKNPPLLGMTKCFFTEGELDTKLYELSKLLASHIITGPAIIIDKNSTILVEPSCQATITDEGNVVIEIVDHQVKKIDTSMDPIQLSIFSHRFMSIAEQMGTILQRTAISTNIKERLDFSCALFGPEGGLIANAPHIPVHLGGMQATVMFQIANLGFDGMEDGDVILANHPMAGGSHLPDLTVITPVYINKSKRPEFFVANRGHHSDIGGLVPGSMPPHSTSLSQEGAQFVSFKVVKKGVFQEKELTDLLMAPAKYPGCTGTRNLSDNLSDLRAQIAANQKGITLVTELIECYGLEVVQAYMAHIQSNAEVAVHQLLRKVGRETREKFGKSVLQAEDFMDDGTRIKLTVNIDEDQGEADFDFTGTGTEVYSSCNAPPAVTMAAVIYCIRCLVGHDIPLNQGCLKPIKIKVPPGTIISPHKDAAVVGGNVLTSQRLCDVIFRAFNAVAASQGCMNNTTFGDEKMGGYYETIAGGSGAGNGFDGRSGVHTHMTNTRITDAEILESRYPVILRRFSLRPDSGGAGKFRGGDGVSRFIQFRRPLKLSLLTERRALAPYGLEGGKPGARGSNILRKLDGRCLYLGGKNSIIVAAGDQLEVETPGGGGYGTPEESTEF